jgi:hypothetical protein
MIATDVSKTTPPAPVDSPAAGGQGLPTEILDALQMLAACSDTSPVGLTPATLQAPSALRIDIDLLSMLSHAVPVLERLDAALTVARSTSWEMQDGLLETERMLGAGWADEKRRAVEMVVLRPASNALVAADRALWASVKTIRAQGLAGLFAQGALLREMRRLPGLCRAWWHANRAFRTAAALVDAMMAGSAPIPDDVGAATAQRRLDLYLWAEQQRAALAVVRPVLDAGSAGYEAMESRASAAHSLLERGVVSVEIAGLAGKNAEEINDAILASMIGALMDLDALGAPSSHGRQGLRALSDWYKRTADQHTPERQNWRDRRGIEEAGTDPGDDSAPGGAAGDGSGSAGTDAAVASSDSSAAGASIRHTIEPPTVSPAVPAGNEPPAAAKVTATQESVASLFEDLINKVNGADDEEEDLDPATPGSVKPRHKPRC